MNQDRIVVCSRCGGNACYEQSVGEHKTWLCLGCGFTTSTIMISGSTTVNSVLQVAPELHKDLMFQDSQGRIWMPATITLPEKGMVFLDGTSKESTFWAGIKMVEVTKDDIRANKVKKGQKLKLDSSNITSFPTFIEACDYIGFFDV